MTHRQRYANKLLTLYVMGTLDRDMEEIVQGWMSGDDTGEDEHRALRQLFDDMVRPNTVRDDYTLRSLKAIQAELGFKDRSGARLLARRRRPLRYAIGAMAAAAVLCGVWFMAHSTPDESSDVVQTTLTAQAIPGSTISTNTGETKDIVLPDGSTVKLREQTTLTYAADFANNRRVTMQGEAYFVVSRDELHPFTVNHGQEVSITVLGTEFNFRTEADGDPVETDVADPARPTGSEVAVTLGRVEIDVEGSKVLVNTAQKATVEPTSHKIITTAMGQGEILRHRGMSLSLENVTLIEALHQMSDYYMVEIDISGSVPDVDGVILKLTHDASLEQALDLLQAINPVFSYTLQDGMLTITRL